MDRSLVKRSKKGIIPLGSPPPLSPARESERNAFHRFSEARPGLYISGRAAGKVKHGRRSRRSAPSLRWKCASGDGGSGTSAPEPPPSVVLRHRPDAKAEA
eukprot:1182342-Prorocentrum_minimum.AAC.1